MGGRVVDRFNQSMSIQGSRKVGVYKGIGLIISSLLNIEIIKMKNKVEKECYGYSPYSSGII